MKKSFSGKVWTKSEDLKDVEKVIEVLLKNRGLDGSEKIQDFLKPCLSKLHDPFDMAGMDKAVERILQAIEDEERIIVFGDFDTDGITSTVILVETLRKLGAKVSYRIPNRNVDSHGLKDYLIDEIATKKVSLVITCDCGVNDCAEITHAKSLGIDVIVTDHHESDENNFPTDAVAVINPKRKDCSYAEKNLSGSAVAFKLMVALASKVLEGGELEEFIMNFLEICAIGIVADCVELTGENRILAKFGIENLKKTEWTGLQKLFERSGIVPESINAETIGFSISPRLNASSRVGDVLKAVELFLGAEDRHFERLTVLENWNYERRDLTESTFKESLEQKIDDASFQFFMEDSWEPGILGLLCSRWVEELDRPAVAATVREDGKLTASCRAPEGFSIIKALKSCSGDLFEKVGGHDGAAGFLTKKENAKKIVEELENYFNSFERRDPTVKVDAFLDAKIFLKMKEVADFLKYLAPFGKGNETPIFAVRNTEIVNFSTMGKNENHARLVAKVDDEMYDFVNFFHGDFLKKIHIGKKMDIAFTVSENFFRGECKLQFRIVDGR
ncbi:MAG: single-stranded-DNA-specific exonuclease RecJ [Candidatus Peregrinibacteria bacterium]|nr:single-stranded-DNA-specific exonuclease RecJ [Candidatus Peregrinibacteria bacterium]